MIVDVGGAASGAERDATAPARGGPGHGTRRGMLRGLLAPALAVALTPLVTASRPSPAPDAAEGIEDILTRTGARPARPEPQAAGPAGTAAFDETYRGRRIRGARAAAGHAVSAGAWHVTVDGRPLHLMRRADGGWLSMIDHYRSYPTPLAAARAAVDELGGEPLREAPAGDGRHHFGHSSGGHRGVHA
ncbi:tyrosinase family oxidase copper chaperone [Streptomyces mutabilis]|uniref:Tyrosinase n=1 Tax=Streptomyces mutabilis TaxID=67332 RepID=A0A086N2U1_9ACTN|nr:tyrosinase family oxidase copper chaperone [Streptomyces mutabilis]KFG75459.1 tyrosinase [Streptomyces mutabilis]